MVLGLGNSLVKSYVSGDTPYITTTSFDFDGADDNINFGNSWNLKGRVTDTSEGIGISVAAWFKIDDIQTTGVGQSILHSIQYPGGWSLMWSNTRMQATMNYGDATRTDQLQVQGAWRTLGNPAAGTELRASGWHHSGFTFDGRYLKLYLNGGLLGTADAGSDDHYIHHRTPSDVGGATQPTCPHVNDADVLIGADPNALSSDGSGCGISGTSPGSTNMFEGLINEAAIWNKVLDVDAYDAIFEAVNTDGAVLDLTKNSGNYTNSGDLVALYRGNSIDGTTVTNVANPGTHNGSMKNSVGTSSTVPS